MTVADDLVDLERTGWEALTTDGGGASFYDEHLAEDVLMLLPGGLVMDERSAIVESFRGAQWESYEMSDVRVLALGPDAAVVGYRAVAVRDGEPYDALFNSTWVRTPDGWRMAVHQQTPVSER